MKKFFCFLFLFSTVLSSAYSQSETVQQFEGTNRPAYTLELNHPVDEVKESFLDYMKTTANVKGVYKKGVYRFNGVVIPAISNEKMDYYATIERKSKKEKNVTVVHFYVSKGYDHFISSRSDAEIGSRALAFAGALIPHTGKLKAEKDLKNQQKKADDSVNQLKKMEKKVAQLEKDLQNAKTELEKQRKLVEKETEKLNEMRKTN